MQRTVNIGSFNMYKFSNESGDEIKKNYIKIARIIRSARFELVALQEVLSEDALLRLIEELNKQTGVEWDYYWDRPKAGNIPRLLYSNMTEAERNKLVTVEEGYAFIWNPEKIRKASYVNRNGEERIFEPRILNQYYKEKYSVWSEAEQQTIVRVSRLQELVRNPLYGRFVPLTKNGDSGFEIRLINAHIMFNRSRSSDLVNAIESDYYLRQNEFRTLATAVLPKISEKVYGNQLGSNPTVAYTFLVGDFNLNIKGTPDNSLIPNVGPYLEDEFLIYRGEDDGLVRISYIASKSRSSQFDKDRTSQLSPIRDIITIQNERSSLSSPIQLKSSKLTDEEIAAEIEKREKEKMGKGKLDPGEILANNYDHVTYDKMRTKGVKIEECGVVNPIYTRLGVRNDSQDEPISDFGGDYRTYRKEVSDHLPIKMKINVSSMGGRL